MKAKPTYSSDVFCFSTWVIPPSGYPGQPPGFARRHRSASHKSPFSTSQPRLTPSGPCTQCLSPIVRIMGGCSCRPNAQEGCVFSGCHLPTATKSNAPLPPAPLSSPSPAVEDGLLPGAQLVHSLGHHICKLHELAAEGRLAQQQDEGIHAAGGGRERGTAVLA